MAILLAVGPAGAAAASQETGPDAWEDLKEGFSLTKAGFGEQFRDPDSRNALIGGGLISAGIAFADNDLLDSARRIDFFTEDAVAFVGDELPVAMGFGPLLTYGLARRFENDKLRRFSIETFGAMMLAYGETVVLSQIPTHERPRDKYEDKTSGFFNTALRGSYSWPSGHIVAPLMFTLKSYDYYGWKAALIPATVTAITVVSRVADEYHYPSDFAAGAALAVAAHLATRKLYRGSDGDALEVSFLPEGGFLLAGRKRF